MPLSKLGNCVNVKSIVQFASLLVILLLIMGALPTNASSAPTTLPPIAKVLPPSTPGCFQYNAQSGSWNAIACAPLANLTGTEGLPPLEGGITTIYGQSLPSGTISTGEVYVSLTQFSGELDAACKTSNTFSIQANTNKFTGSNGHQDEIQFTMENNWQYSLTSPCHLNTAYVCMWQVDVTAQQYSHNCVAVSLQTLSSSYSSYISGIYSGGTDTSMFCSYQQNTCWSASMTDSWGLNLHWNQLSGTILGVGGGSTALFTSPTTLNVQVSFAGLGSQIFSSTKNTNEQNNLAYSSVNQYCQRSTCYTTSVSN